MTPTTSQYIEINHSKIHNKGIFAKTDIPKGTKIIQYVGEKILKSESDKRADITIEESENDQSKGAVYIFNLNKRYDIDGSVEWNTAKWINHSCSPNCETESDNKEVWIISKKDINKGDELSYDYSYDLPFYQDHICKCGSPNCIGYILKEDLWHKLFKKLRKKQNT
jgi:uncharacterized protein